MSTNLTQLKSFLGQYYAELANSSTKDKYAKSQLSKIFDQKYQMQSNKAQMIVDPSLVGLIAIVSGNEIHISASLYNHPGVNVTNSLENQQGIKNNPKSLYNPEVLSTMAYLICQNHTMFHIIGEVDEPIYIRYTSDYETFYNSVVVVNVSENIDIEVVEEYESRCALNSVTNFIVHKYSKLSVSTFYNNSAAAISLCLRNVIVQENASYTHTLFGKGSAMALDETRLQASDQANVELFGCINPGQQEFHIIVGIQPSSQDYDFSLDHRHVVGGKGKTTYTPAIAGHLPAISHTNVSSFVTDTVAEADRPAKIAKFLLPITERATLERTLGTERFYANKSKFLKNQ